MKIEEYNSVKKWFTKGVHGHPYSHKTVKPFVGFMNMFCHILNKTPDELAKLSSEQALEAQIKLATVMKEELGFREVTIYQRMGVLHSFWRANNVQVTDDIIRYKGTSWLLRRIRKRDNFTLTSYRRGKIR